MLRVLPEPSIKEYMRLTAAITHTQHLLNELCDRRARGVCVEIDGCDHFKSSLISFEKYGDLKGAVMEVLEKRVQDLRGEKEALLADCAAVEQAGGST